MVSLLTLTNRFVYKFLKKQVKKENKVRTTEGSNNDFKWDEHIKGLTISNEVIELRRRFLLAIGEDENSQENDTSGNEGLMGLTQNTNFEKLKEFIQKNLDENGILPSVKLIEEGTELTEKQQKNIKKKLFEAGYLYKENERVYKLNPDFVRM